MSQQALDLPRAVQTVRRYRILVGIMAVLGLLVGAAYATLNPPMFTGTALVLLPEDAQSAQSAQAVQDGVGNRHQYDRCLYGRSSGGRRQRSSAFRRSAQR